MKHYVSRIRLILILVLGISMILACSRPPSQKQEILVLLKTLDTSFFTEIVRGVKETPIDSTIYHLDFRAGTQEGDVANQREIMDSYYTRLVANRETPLLAGVILTPSGSKDELTFQIKRLMDKKVPVVVVDTRIEKEALLRAGIDSIIFIGSSNYAGGVKAGQLMIERLTKGGNILMLNGVDGQQTAADRRDGFMHVLDSVNNLTQRSFRVTHRTANWRRSEARSLVGGLIALGRRFDGIFAANDEMALGALEAMPREKGWVLPTIVGFDAIKEARDAVDQGLMTATVAQDPYRMGVEAVQALENTWGNKPTTREIIIEVKVVTKK